MKPDEIDYDNLTFSFTETKSMYVSKCKINEKWKKGKLIPFNEFKISPAATILNYGQGLFEGMKAYKTDNDEIICLLYTSPSPRDDCPSRMPSSA